MHARLFPLVAAVSILSGCGSMTGFTESKSQFACKAPDGVTCTSVSGVYANAMQNNLPAQQTRSRSAPAAAALPVPTGGAAFPIVAAGMPIRSQARMLRIWVAPWRDEDDTLHDQSYMYIMVDPGRWLVERSRESTVKTTLARLQPLGRPRSTAQAASEQPTSQGSLAQVRNNSAAQAAAREAANVPGDAEESK
jgi:conjugal transfer pilus assembly protein TraV